MTDRKRLEKLSRDFSDKEARKLNRRSKARSNESTTTTMHNFGTDRPADLALLRAINGAARSSEHVLENLGVSFKVERVTRRAVARCALARIVRGRPWRAWSRGRADAQALSFQQKVIDMAGERLTREKRQAAFEREILRKDKVDG